MPVEKTTVTAVRVRHRCDKCRQAYYKFTGFTQMSSPPKYQHVCTNCGDTVYFSLRYPTIEYYDDDELKAQGIEKPLT